MAAGDVISIETPLGDALRFHSMRGTVELGRMFRYDVTLVSTRGDIDLRELLCKRVTIYLQLPDGRRRPMSGHVVSFRQSGTRGRLHTYEACVRPWLWLLTRRSNCRIFQKKTVEDIVKSIFADPVYQDLEVGEIRWQASTRTHPAREFCVQYRESDFNFISRLLEDEGIYYWFQERDEKETLIFTDGLAAHEPAPGYASLPYRSSLTGVPIAEYVTQWESQYGVETRNFMLTDYDFENPSRSLRKKAVKEMAGFDTFSDLEHFDFPGGYVDPDHGESRARTRSDESWDDDESPGWHRVEARTNARGLQVGARMKLREHPRDDQNIEYLITRARLEIELAGYEGLDGEQATRFECWFCATDVREELAPARVTRKPFVQGPQTAVVVGPSHDEIYTDKYGRVKVQFVWDREGKADENSSCWIRVSHPWAGKSWGMVAIPRIGQEVIVDFLEGDPDRPIITGRVYNAEQMPPYDLPTSMTQWGIKSRSTTGGSGANCNELRFEDKKDHEQLLIHAERDHSVEVEASETHSVGYDLSKTIGHDETSHVKRDLNSTVERNEMRTVKGTRTRIVEGDETTTLKANSIMSVVIDRRVKIGGNHIAEISGKEAVSITGDRDVKVTGFKRETVEKSKEEKVAEGKLLDVGADYRLQVKGARQTDVKGLQFEEIHGSQTSKIGADHQMDITGNQKITVGQAVTVQAGTSFKITCGKSTFEMDSEGNITINGENIASKGAKSHTIKGLMVSSSATAKNTVEGTVLMLNP